MLWSESQRVEHDLATEQQEEATGACCLALSLHYLRTWQEDDNL